MKQVIFICLMIFATNSTLTSKVKCDCTKFTSSTECNNVDGCVWGATSCGAKECSAATDGCDFLGNCTLNNNDVCEKTGECSSYTVKERVYCMIYKGNCGSLPTLTNDLYTCASYTKANCTSLAADACNYSYVDEDNFCWLDTNGKCQQYSWNSCIGIPMDVCGNLKCDSEGTSCKSPTCSQLSSPELCQYVKDGLFGQETLCKWDTTNKVCMDRTDVSDFTQDTQMVDSIGQKILVLHVMKVPTIVMQLYCFLMLPFQQLHNETYQKTNYQKNLYNFLP